LVYDVQVTGTPTGEIREVTARKAEVADIVATDDTSGDGSGPSVQGFAQAVIPPVTFIGDHIELNVDFDGTFFSRFESYVIQQTEYSSTDPGHLHKLWQALNKIRKAAARGEASWDLYADAEDLAAPIFERQWMLDVLAKTASSEFVSGVVGTSATWLGAGFASFAGGYAVGTGVNSLLDSAVFGPQGLGGALHDRIYGK
jgi:hypothetical protein